jgi:hypothetical protein
MSVFKLTDKDREEIINATEAIASRKQDFEVSRCPITISDLEKVLNDPEGLEIANKALAAGYDITKFNDIRMRINDKCLGGDEAKGNLLCPRFIGVGFVPEKDILCRLMLDKRGKDWSKHHECGHVFDMTRLGETKCLEIAAWVNKVHRAVRERHLCVNVVTKYLAHMPTTASVLATWPTLATLPRKDNKDGVRLRDRFRAGPPARTLYRYKITWPTSGGPEFEDVNTMMAGAEEVLVKGLMLEGKYSPLPGTGMRVIRVHKFESVPDAPWYLRTKE